MEKQLIPQLRFPEFSDNWKKCKIGDTFKLFNGYAFSSSDSLNSDGALWVKIADVGIDKMKTDNLSYLPYEYVEKYEKFVLKEGDYVIALTRPILSGDLKIARIDEYFNNSLLNQRVAKLITDNNSTFIYNLLKGNRLIKSIENNIAGSDPPNLSPNDINHIKINIPSLPEQKKIASFLSDVDAKITKLTKKKDLLEQYKKGVMQKIFNQELRFKDDNGNAFPKWEMKKLGDISICLDNKRIPLNEAERNNKQGSIPYWGANGILDYVDEYIFDETIVLLAEDGGYFHEFQTRPIANISYGKSWVNNHAHVIKAVKGLTTNEYLYYSLVHKNILGYINGGTRAKLNKSEMLKIKMIVPSSIEEQTKIANFLSDIDLKIEALNTKIETTKAFKKGLLHQMFV